MKIVLVNKFHYVKGGTETYCFSLAKALVDRGHEVHFFSMDDERNEPCRDSRYFVSNVDFNSEKSIVKNAKNALASIYSLEARKKFNMLLSDIEPDIVHLNLIHRQISFSIMDAPLMKGIPVVFTAHDHSLICPAANMVDYQGGVCSLCCNGDYFHCIKKSCIKGSKLKSTLALLEASFLRARGYYDRIDRIIVPSEYLRNKLSECGFNDKGIQVIRNGLALDEWDSSPYKMSQERKYFLYVGRLSSEKGVSDLLVAFSLIRSRMKGCHLLIAGDGELMGQLQRDAVFLSIEDNVDFLGFKRGKHLKELVSNAWFTIAPSRCPETFCYSAMESLAMGTPVIGTRMGAIPENVIDGVTGFLANPSDPVSLAEAIVKASKLDTEEYRELSEKGMKYAQSFGSQEEHVNSVLKLYADLIAAKHTEITDDKTVYSRA